MVNESVLVRDKYSGLKKFLKYLGIFVLVVVVVFAVYYSVRGLFFERQQIILENPVKDIVLKHVGEGGEVSAEDSDKIVEEAVLEFNAEYINYILVALGINHLHKSPTFENPFIELVLDDEVWNSEIKNGVPDTKKGKTDNEDVRFVLSKDEAVRAILTKDIRGFMKESVSSGRTKIVMVAGKTELFSKGYLGLYKELTGEEIKT